MLSGGVTDYMGFISPGRMIRRAPARMRTAPGRVIFSLHSVRGADFLFVSSAGLILGALGAEWPVVAPFLAVSSAAVIVTFPTKERWKRMVSQLS